MKKILTLGLITTSIATLSCASKSYTQESASTLPFSNKPLIEQIVKQSASLKTNITAQNGANIYTATYNGNDGTCDYVSVIVNVEYSKNYERIENFKVCNNQVNYTGQTIYNLANQENINKISQKLAKECKTYGEANYYDASTKTTVTCKAKDLNRRFFEISVFDENMKLLNKRIIEDK